MGNINPWLFYYWILNMEDLCSRNPAYRQAGFRLRYSGNGDAG
jgi:hypothetical protein